MRLPPNIDVFGDKDFRGDCPTETAEQIAFFGWIRREYPDSYGRIAVHIKNEGKRNHRQAARDKANGMTTGASDIVLPGAPALVIELKRQDHTKCKIDDDQIKYLLAAKKAGAVAVIALGCEAAIEAFNYYLRIKK